MKRFLVKPKNNGEKCISDLGRDNIGKTMNGKEITNPVNNRLTVPVGANAVIEQVA